MEKDLTERQKRRKLRQDRRKFRRGEYEVKVREEINMVEEMHGDFHEECGDR